MPEDFQEFMVAPVGAPSMPEAVRAGAEVYSALRRELSGRKLSTGLGDEGGFAPEIAEPEEVLRLLVRPSPTPGTRRAPRACRLAPSLRYGMPEGWEPASTAQRRRE